MSAKIVYKKILVDEDIDDVEAYYPSKPIQRDPIRKPTVQHRNGVSCSCCCRCFGICMLITLVLITILLIPVVFGAYLMILDGVEHLTLVTSQEQQYPIVNMSDVELQLFKDRVKLFLDQLYNDTITPPPLVVTQDEVNGCLCKSDYLRGNIMITFDQNMVVEEHSLPVWMLPGGRHRSFVGKDSIVLGLNSTVEVQMEISADNNDWFEGPLLFAKLSYIIENYDDDKRILELYLEKGNFLGDRLQLPEDFIDKHQNLLEDFHDDDGDDDDDEYSKDVRSFSEVIESVAIEPGKITVYPRPR